MSISDSSRIKLNIPVNKISFFILIISFLGFITFFFYLPTLILQKLGPLYVGSQTDFLYQYYYTLLDALEETQQVTFALLYMVLWIVFSVIIFTWLTVGLKNKIIWSHPEEFYGCEKELKKLKKLFLPALISLVLLLYLALDTYLLVGDGGIVYNSFWSLQLDDRQFTDVKNLDSVYYAKDKVFHYYLVFNDGKRLLIDPEGAKFISAKTKLPIREK